MKLPTLLLSAASAAALFCNTRAVANDDQGDNTRGAVLTVDDDHAQCPDAQYTSIQAAVNAAKPGDTINVCPGTYQEQVKVNKSLKIQGIDVKNQNLALIKPAGVVPNSTSLSSGNPVAAIVLVDGVANVILRNLTVDGSNNAINGCAPDFVGVYYRNASGKIDELAIRNIKLGPGLEGCQSGLGLYVQSGAGGSSKVEISNSSIHDYQKGGIVANEKGTQLTARGNAIVGIGTTNAIAQNGLQIGFGAEGTVEGNSIINHLYGLCTLLSCNSASSANILVYQASEVEIENNTLGKSQVNIDLESNGAEVSQNFIFDTDVFDGVYVLGNNNNIQNNSIFKSDEAGVYVDGNNNKVQGNTINEAPVGIFQTATSSGNSIKSNRFYNVGLDSSKPTAAPLALASALGTGASKPAAVPLRP